MTLYGIGILPHLTVIHRDNNETKHSAFADNLAGVKTLRELLKWWNNIGRFGPLLGYYPKASKSWLVVKPELLEEAKVIFAGTDINITSHGHKHLGGFI